MINLPLIQSVTNKRPILGAGFIKQLPFCFLVLSILFMYSGCSGLSAPSDKEAPQLVSEYYLYYGGGEDVDVSIVKREEYNDGCKCYPIKFQVTRSRASSGLKTFYFFKGPSGTFTLKKYANAVKQ